MCYSNLLLTRVRPSIWIPACEVTWSVLTIIMAKCTNVQQLYALRFFIGLAESTFYPGMQHYLSIYWPSYPIKGRPSFLISQWRLRQTQVPSLNHNNIHNINTHKVNKSYHHFQC